ncbi:MAG: hypothetical protein KDJ41_02960 [Hyphomicrobiaceae bacterium]|nr:hypothetical protein [Hyphomicrobiaceae bacterium]
MSKILKVVVAVGALAFATSTATMEAEARIRCNGPYQVLSSGSEHATPYCEDNYLAKVARGYGMRFSDRSVRQNPSVKAEICRTIGHDSRIQHICAQYRDGPRRH